MSRKEKIIKQLTALATVSLGGLTTFAGLCIWNGNENFYCDYVMPFTQQRLDPEKSNNLAVFMMKHSLIGKQQRSDPESLATMPRVFRLKEDAALINRYGFNSEGHKAVFNRVKLESDKQERAIIGVNLGKNKLTTTAAQDYIAGVEKFGEVADYLVINRGDEGVLLRDHYILEICSVMTNFLRIGFKISSRRGQPN